MPNLYNYYPYYGIEPYNAQGVAVSADYGGGADITNQNLLLTLYGNVVTQNNVPTSGQLLKPLLHTSDGQASVAGAGAAGIGLARALEPAFNSRYSARFALNNTLVGGEDNLTNTLLAVLQPSQDYANYMLSVALKLTASSFEFGQSYWLSQAWGFDATSEHYSVLAEDAIFGNFAFSGSLPFTKTSGADGTFPQFYTATTIPENIAVLKALVEGEDFFIPVLFTRNETLNSTSIESFSISWPGTNARR